MVNGEMGNEWKMVRVIVVCVRTECAANLLMHSPL